MRETQYCGKACQTNHWPEHKGVCKSPLGKTNWRPQWERDGREPAWARGDAPKNWHNPFGAGKYLWGNIPAIDILRLEQNEGRGYRQSLALLFAGNLPWIRLHEEYTNTGTTTQRPETYEM